jgi:peptidoglycan/LPS O-acetylase OafA/YrhL
MWPVYALVFHLFGLWLLARLVLGSDTDIAFQGVQPVLSVGQWVQQVLMVQMWDDPYLDGASWVGSTWSISAEWLAYLLFPAAALVFFRLRNLPVAVLGAAAVALMVPIATAWVAWATPTTRGAGPSASCAGSPRACSSTSSCGACRAPRPSGAPPPGPPPCCPC